MRINLISHTKSKSDIILPEILKTKVSNQFLSKLTPFKLVFSFCEFTKVILMEKNWFEMFVLKISRKQTSFMGENDNIL